MHQSSGLEILTAIAQEAREHGQDLAALLHASAINDAEKAAWVALLPAMDATSLSQFTAILEKTTQADAADDFEEAIITIRANESQRMLEETAQVASFAHALEALEAKCLIAQRGR